MSDIDNFDAPEVPLVQDELATLKARADLVGMDYHPSIGAAKLRARLEEFMAEPVEDEVVQASAPKAAAEPEELSPAALRVQRRREAAELVRIRLTCMNPIKSEWEGEFFSAGNGAVGTFTKFVPFNADDGWHVPRIIYNQIIQRRCQVFYTTRDARGQASRVGKLIREFSVEVLPQLTKVELTELARRQAMSQAID